MNVIALVAFWSFWFVGLLYVYTLGVIVRSKDSPFANVEWNKNTRNILIYYLFAGLWANAFIMASTEFVLASSVCIWYFSRGEG